MVKSIITKSANKILPILLVLTLFGCSKTKIEEPFDLQNGITKQQLKQDLLYKNKKQNKQSNINIESPIPQISRMIAIPKPPSKNSQKTVSLSVTENVPLKDVLIELSRSAKIDIDLDHNISGGIIINAKDRPLNEILDRICNMANLRYSFENGVLNIKRDLPFSKNYMVDYLISGNLWSEVETNIASILDENQSNSTDSNNSAPSISSNKLANIITIHASEKGHKKVSDYLASVSENSSAQVLIEAKVVEVTLTDNYKTGIDWSWAEGGKGTTTQSAGFNSTDPISIVLGSSNLFSGNIDASISALEEFGVVKAIASPRINALNNQKATLNFTQKLVYFITEIQNNTTTSNGVNDETETITSTKFEEPTGTELSITPSIDLKTGEITLEVEPKITIQSSEVEQIVYSTGTTIPPNKIPVINTRELKTIAKVQSGNILVIGGVMNEVVTNNDTGIPFLMDIPYLGNLFKSVTRNSEITETVIFIKATIVRPSDRVQKYDRKINDDFSSSSRPFFDK